LTEIPLIHTQGPSKVSPTNAHPPCICTVQYIVRMLMVGGLLFSELDSALF